MGAIAPGMPYVDATPKEVFVGMNCKEELAKQIFEIARDLSVPVHRMGFDEYSPNYNLVIKD